MRSYTGLLAIVVVAYVLCFTTGCSLLPLSDPHAHEEHEKKEQQEAEKTPAEEEEEMDPDFMMAPPQLREIMKHASVDDVIKMLSEAEGETAADAVTVVAYVYNKRANAAEKSKIDAIALEMIGDKKDSTRRKLGLQLLQQLGRTHFEQRVALATSDSDPAVRKAAIATLLEDGSKALKPLEILKNDPDAEIRQYAQDLLTQLRTRVGDEAVIKDLVHDLGIYKDDASALASTAIVVKGAVSLPYLIEAAKNDANEYRRAASALCIGIICAGNNKTLDEFADRAKAFGQGEQQRQDANLDGLEPLIYVLKNDKFAPSRAAAAQGLGYLGSEKAAATLAAALSDKDAMVRRRAAAALETVPAKAVVKQISKAVRDEDEAVRSFAVRALGNIGTQEAIDYIAIATRDRSASVRESAADELGRLEAHSALDNLLVLFKDEDEDVRWAAVRAVGDLRSDDAIPNLIEALRDPYPQVSNAAERGLQKVGIAQRKGVGFKDEDKEATKPTWRNE